MVRIVIGLKLIQSFILLISRDVHMCLLIYLQFHINMTDWVLPVYNVVGHYRVIVVVLMNLTALNRGELLAEVVDIHTEDSVV